MHGHPSACPVAAELIALPGQGAMQQERLPDLVIASSLPAVDGVSATAPVPVSSSGPLCVAQSPGDAEAALRLAGFVTLLRGAVDSDSTRIPEVIQHLREVLGVDAVAYLERVPGNRAFRLREGVGWRRELIAEPAIAAGSTTFANFAYEAREPVVVTDVRRETRFVFSPLLQDHGFVSGIAASVGGHDATLGVLGVYSRQQRRYSDSDARGLREIADLLGAQLGGPRQEPGSYPPRGDLYAVLADMVGGLPEPARTFVVLPPAMLPKPGPPADWPAGSADGGRVPPRGWKLRGVSITSARPIHRHIASDGHIAPHVPRHIRPPGSPSRHGIVRPAHEVRGDGVPVLAEEVAVSELLEVDRLRVAYDIHDGFAQVAASAYQYLEAFAERYPAASSEEQLDMQRVRELAGRTIREARRMIADLRAATLGDFSLEAALCEEVQALRAAGHQVTFAGSVPGPIQPLSRPVAVGLYRVAQEALTNARKYAGPTPIEVTLRYRADRVQLEIRDYGKGFDSAALARPRAADERVGLVGMRERMAMLGGICEIVSRPGEGTRVSAVITLGD